MKEIDRFKDYLRQSGMLVTQERLAIAKAVCDTDDIFNIETLRESLIHKNYPVSNATIYRNVKLLIEAGIIESSCQGCPSKNSFRKIGSKPVSCIIKCTDCPCEYSASNEELEKAALKLCEEFNMEQTGIVINIRGRRKCNCKQKKKNVRR